MQHTHHYHKNKGSTVFDPAVVGIVTFLISVSLFCFFLLSLQRGTPHLWPYATTIVARNHFAIEPFIEIDKKPHPFLYDEPKWVLNFQNDPILFSESFPQETFIREGVSEQKKPETEFFFHYSVPPPTYRQSTYITVNEKEYLWLGGFKDFTQTSPYLTLPPMHALNNSWYGANPRDILSSSTLRDGPPMCVGRAQPELLREKNKNVLISGGRTEYRPSLIGSESTATDSIEEYDCKLRKFTSLGQMQVPRYEHTTRLLADGNILIVSGRTNAKLSDSLDNLTSTIEVFSPQTKTSTIVGQLHRAMAKPILIPLKDGKVFILDRNTLTSRTDMQPYAELYENTRVPVQKLPHMPSIAEIVHTIMHWKN
jgi:hypothetical protein